VEIGSVEKVKTRSDAARQHHDRFMPAAPRLPDLVALLDPRFAQPGRLRFDQANLRIAAKRAKSTVYPFGAGESGIKHRNTIDAAASDAQIT